MATRTLTEFSGTLIRMASKAESEAKKALPKELAQIVPSPAPTEAELTAQPMPHAPAAGEVPHREPDVEGGPSESTEAGAFESATDAADEMAAKEKAAESDVPAEPARPSIDEFAETDAVKVLLDEAVAKATNTTGDRLARLRDALKATGRQADRVRLVRVFGGEDAVPGAKKIGEHQYLVDLMPASMKQVFKDPKDDKNKSRGPKKPSGAPKSADGQSLEGSFSMEAVAADRKNERGPGKGRPGAGGPGGGRPGGARGRPGGGAGRPGGGRPSGAPKP